MDDYEYIRKFAKITISGACKKNKVDICNLISGRTSKEKTKKVRRQIENDIANLYIIKEGNNEERESSL